MPKNSEVTPEEYGEMQLDLDFFVGDIDYRLSELWRLSHNNPGKNIPNFFEFNKKCSEFKMYLDNFSETLAVWVEPELYEEEDEAE